MNQKQINAAQAALRKGAASAASACGAILAAVRLAVQAGIVESVTTAAEGKSLGETKKAAVVEWARETLKDDGSAFETSRAYIQQSAAVALVPDAVGEMKAAKGAKTLIKANKIKTAREMAAVAKAANEKLGVKPRGTRTATASPDAAKVAALQEELAKAKAAAVAAPPLLDSAQAVAVEIVRIFKTGTPSDRVKVAEALAAYGFKLVPLEAKAAPTKKKTAPVKPSARKPGRKVGYGESARA